MNTRRLSFGLLVSLAAAAIAVGCGDSTPPAETAPQPSATAAATTSVAEVAPPPVTATAEQPPPPPPPPPAKPSKEKWVGKFTQDFSGDVLNAADADAKKKAGKADKDNKKYNAAMDKAKAAVADNTIENTPDGTVWSTKGKAKHTMGIKVVSGDDPASLKIQFVKDGKKDLKAPIDVSINFKDDNTFEIQDPWAKKNAQTFVFKRQ
jgi:hypothetical protein